MSRFHDYEVKKAPDCLVQTELDALRLDVEFFKQGGVLEEGRLLEIVSVLSESMQAALHLIENLESEVDEAPSRSEVENAEQEAYDSAHERDEAECEVQNLKAAIRDAVTLATDAKCAKLPTVRAIKDILTTL